MALEKALRPYRPAGRPLALLFSGGLDSALLAWELRTRPDFELVTVGLPGAPDLAAAGAAARAMGLPWKGREVSPEDVRRSLRHLAEELAAVPGPLRSVFVALDLAIASARDGSTLLCGQGADELFLGYAHFRGLSADEAGARAEADLARLRHEDWPRTERIARARGHEIAAPYLTPEFVRAAQRIPVTARLPGETSKDVLREFAVARGLPVEIARRPKRAVQYGSGVERALRQNGFAPRENPRPARSVPGPGPRIK